MTGRIRVTGLVAVIAAILLTPFAHATDLGVTIKTQNVVQLTNALKNLDMIPKNAVWVRLEYAGAEYENGTIKSKNEEYARQFWQLLSELKQRNKKIWLVFGVPDGTTKDNYQKAITAEMTLLPDILPYVDVVQVGNEMDCQDFIGYKPIPGCDWKKYDGGAYVKRVLYFVEQVGDKVQQYNHNKNGHHVGLAVNLSSWPLMNGNISEETEFVRQLSNYVDTVGLDLYPKNNGELVQYTTKVISVFKKDFPHVFVSETGMSATEKPTNCKDVFTEDEQARWLPAAIDAERKAGPEAIILYMLQDIPAAGTDCQAIKEAHFGIIREDGTKKPAYYAIFEETSLQRSLEMALETELHKWYPETPDGNWELNVTKTVQKVYPNVVEANLSGSYAIEKYWKVSANTRRTPEEIVKGWEEGYEIAKIRITADEYPGLPEENYGWYFVKIPAKLSMVRNHVEGEMNTNAKITVESCYRNLPEKMRPLGVGCVQYDVNVTPDSTEYNFVVHSVSGKILKDELARGDRTFRITWPLNPTIPHFENLLPGCAEVIINGKTLAKSCGGAPRPHEAPQKKWNVKIESNYPYKYHIVGNKLLLQISVNYLAKNSCERLHAVVTPLRCPNCYQVSIHVVKPSPEMRCAEVMHRITSVYATIPLQTTTNSVYVKIVGPETGSPEIPPNPIICMKIEGYSLKIKQALENCKLKCTNADKQRILEEIKELEANAARNGCKVVIPKPVFPKIAQPTTETPPGSAAPTKSNNEQQNKGSTRPEQPAVAQKIQKTPASPVIIQPIIRIWDAFKSIFHFL